VTPRFPPPARRKDCKTFCCVHVSCAGSGGETTMAKKPGERELIDTGTDKRFVRRDENGRFAESDDVGRSLAQDVRKHAKTVVKPGQGDKGDQKRR
jgi:hypothetical protein